MPKKPRPKYPPIILLTGASGAGKSTVLDEILHAKNLPVVKFITCTTRPPRKGEKHGRDYWFLTKQEFKKRIAADDFYEWADVYGKYYGSSKADLERMAKKRKAIVFVIDVQGTKTIKRQLPEAISIFIDAPTASLKARLLARGADLNDLKRRLDEISKEKRYRRSADIVLDNRDGNLKETVRAVSEIIRKALRAKS